MLKCMHLLWLMVISMVHGESSYQYYYRPDLPKELITIIKASDVSFIQIYQCQHKIDRIIYHCGNNSYHLIEGFEFHDEMKEISRDDCLNIHENRTLWDASGTVRNLMGNGSSILKEQVAGKKTARGCEGAVFDNGTRKWSNVVVEYISTFSVLDFRAIVSPFKNLINVNGTNYKYSNLECIDKKQFYTFWKHKEVSNYATVLNTLARILAVIEPPAVKFQIYLMSNVSNFLLFIIYFFHVMLVVTSVFRMGNFGIRIVIGN